MTRQEYKTWAKEKVSDLAITYATQRELFNKAFDENDHNGTDYFLNRMNTTLNEILSFVE